MARAAAKASSGRGPKDALSAERIEIAALALIEAEGMAGFSTRKLATVLRCEAMSIYHYFPSKGHLMDALVDRVVGAELTVPGPAPKDWRTKLETVVYEYRAMALKYPNFFGFLALHRFNTPQSLGWLNGMLALFQSIGVSGETAARLFRAVGYYVTGSMLDETAGYARGPSTVDPVPDAVMAERYPSVVSAGKWFQESQWEATFALGFRVVLNGIEQVVKAAKK